MRVYFIGGPWIGEAKELMEPLPPMITVPWPREPLSISHSANPLSTSLDLFYYDLHRIEFGETIYLYAPRGWTNLDIMQRLLSWYVR